MTNKYNATNKEESTIRLTQQRANYRLQAFKDELGETPQNVVNFNFAERTQYGRIDQNLNTIYPIEKNLKMLPNNDEVLFVMDFVHEPFILLQNKMKQATRMGHIPNDPILSQLIPRVAYQNPLDLYLDHMEGYLDLYNKSLDISKIDNYESWVNQFFQWTKRNGANFPLTFSNFHRTKLSNIYTSGLAISIAELDKGNDPIKENLFLNNKTLEFYLNAAKQFGFSVSKNSPWLLVSDLNSPASIIYHKNFNLSNINEIFSEKYSLCYLQDRDLFFVSTGIGVSPFRSMLGWIAQNKVPIKNVKLFFGTRKKEDIPYYEEMKNYEKIIPNFEFVPCLSQEKWEGHNGYVHGAYLPELTIMDEKPLVYFCGWTKMIDEGREYLSDLGFEMMKDIRVEIFG